MALRAMKRFPKLAALEPGQINLRKLPRKWWQLPKWSGWLSIDHETKGEVCIMWTSHKESHFPLICGRPAVSISVDKDGNLISFFESALSMWLKWGYGRGTEADHQSGLKIAEWMESVIP